MSSLVVEISAAVKELRLTGRPVCIHSSLRSFGNAEGGASAIIEGLLAEGCTSLVPTFSYKFLVPPPPEQRPPRNGWDYASNTVSPIGASLVYVGNSEEIDRDMGALAAAVVTWPGRIRGDHALNSFTAVGPLARRLISMQRPSDVYGPLKELAAADGFVVLMGVGAQRMTLIHLAEALAGRRLFRRWANGPDGRPMMYETGGCSEGFDNLEPIISLYGVTARVGQSRWRAFPARSTLAALAEEIRSRPDVTRCGNPSCERCDDAVKGGPVLST
jgi:aminoglycoside 3-N-acetyltransferase